MDRIFFSRNEHIKEIYCIKECQQKIYNEHLKWCEKINRKKTILSTLIY